MRLISDMLDMRGRVAVLTGGGGHIALAMAEALAERGCSILLVDRTPQGVERTTEAVKQLVNEAQIAHVLLDLEVHDQRQALAPEVMRRFGRLDVLINNASFVGDSTLQGWAVPFEHQSIETWRRAMEVNVTAAFHLSQSCAALLRAGGNGAILNVGSIYGVLGPDMKLYEGTQMGNPAAYAASKGALVQMTRWLSTVLAPEIRVNCISPGGLERNQPSTFVDKYVAKTPLGRMGTEEDFKGATVFFTSDLSRWVTGQNLMIDGGWTAW